YEGPNGPVLVMRFAPRDLERVGRAMAPDTWARAGEIALDVANALDYCCSQGIAHRDIKPDNILVGERDEIYLSDFGIAAALDDDARWARPEGARAFLSPETFTDRYTGGRSERRRRCDQFSFGVTLYYMLTGCLPYGGVRNRIEGPDSEWNDCTALRLL